MVARRKRLTRRCPNVKRQTKKKQQAGGKSKVTGAQIIKMADKNSDGVLTIDEYAEKDKKHFPSTDLNGDEKVDANELDAMLKKLQEAVEK